MKRDNRALNQAIQDNLAEIRKDVQSVQRVLDWSINHVYEDTALLQYAEFILNNMPTMLLTVSSLADRLSQLADPSAPEDLPF